MFWNNPILNPPEDLPRHIGETIEFRLDDRVLEVKKISAHTYFLKVRGEKQGRFADYVEHAREDIDHFLRTGVLPRSKSGGF